MRAPALLAALVAAVLACAGCGTAAPASPPPPAASAGPAAAGPRLTLRIPDLAVDATLSELHRDAAGALEAPPVTQPQVAGYYAEGVLPGDRGPGLIAGHVSGRPEGADHSVPGVFARLGELRVGGRVTVDRDGLPLTFEVYRTGTFPKDAFPTGEVYGDTALPELRLVTCGGTFDPAAHSYRDNVIAFARLVP